MVNRPAIAIDQREFPLDDQLDAGSIRGVATNVFRHIPVDPELGKRGNVQFAQRPIVDIQMIPIGAFFVDVVLDRVRQPVEHVVAHIDNSGVPVPRIKRRRQILIPQVEETQRRQEAEKEQCDF